MEDDLKAKQERLKKLIKRYNKILFNMEKCNKDAFELEKEISILEADINK